MADVSQYQQQIGEVFDTSWKNDSIRIEIHCNNVEDAKAALRSTRQRQKELKLIKKHVSADMAAIRKSYQDAIDNVGYGSGPAASIIGRGRAAGIKATERRQQRSKRDKLLKPYNSVKLVIDDLLTQLDGAKLRLEEYIRQHTS